MDISISIWKLYVSRLITSQNMKRFTIISAFQVFHNGWAGRLNMRSCSEENHSSTLSCFVRRWIIVPWPQSSVTHLKMNFSCIFWVMLGRWCQRLQPPAGRACFRADRSQKKAAKYHGLVAGAEVTLLSRTSVFSFPGHKNCLLSWKNQRNQFNSSDESFIARYYLQ